MDKADNSRTTAYVNQEEVAVVLLKLRGFDPNDPLLNLLILIAYQQWYPVRQDEGDRLIAEGLLEKRDDKYVMPDYIRATIKASASLMGNGGTCFITPKMPVAIQ